MKLFKRKIAIFVDDLEVTDLDAQFKAEKTLYQAPSTLDLSIFNLAAETRARMQKKGAKVVLLAGYEAKLETVFSGDARTIDHVRRGPDWVTRIQCGDGERAFKFALSSRSYKAGTSAKDVAIGLAKDLGAGLGNLAQQLATGNFRGGMDQFVHGYAFSGQASRGFDGVMRTLGFEWSIQDGQLQVLRPTEPTKDSIVVLSAETGLVGSPEHGSPDVKGVKPSVLKVRSLLQPSIRPGRRIKVEAVNTKGLFRVEKVTHQGDTLGQDWYSDIECLPTSEVL